MMVNNKIVCELCSSSFITPLFCEKHDRTIYSIFKCLNCKLVFLHPPPPDRTSITNEHISLLTYEKGRIFNTGQGIVTKIKNFVKLLTLKYQYGYFCGSKSQSVQNKLFYLLTFPFKYRFEFIFPTFKPNGKLLDIGCGSGHRMAQLKELGWEVYGIEPSLELVKYGKEKFNLNIVHGFFEEVEVPLNEFDVVTLYHVLEHVPHPKNFLMKVSTVLKEGGELLVVVPNILSLERIIFGRYWNIWMLPWHLWFFSADTLLRLFYETGFKVTKIEHQPIPQIIIWSLRKLVSHFLSGFITAEKILEKIFYNFTLFYILTVLFTPFSFIASFLKLGSCIIVYAKKQ